MERPTILDALTHEEFFRPAFKDLASWSAWITALKVLYGLPLDPSECDVARAATQRETFPEGGFREGYFIVGRRGGKSRTAATIAVYEALFGEWEKHLAKGETAYIFIIATDKTQAKIILDYVRGLLALFPKVVKKESADEITLENSVTISTRAASFRASRGYSTAVAILDELAFMRDETSANPAEEIVTSILPGLLPGGLLLGISTPYAKMGFLYEMFKDNFGKDSDILVWQAGTRVMNPTYSEATIQRLIKRDKVAMTAEYDARFRDDIENFLPEVLIRSVMGRAGTLPPEPGKTYVAFVDPSGGRSDSMTLAIAHHDHERDKIVLDYIEERRPPFDPASVVGDFVNQCRLYGISKVVADRYGGIWVSNAFAAQGFGFEASDIDRSEIYLNFQPLVSMGRVELIDSDRLLLQLQSLERRARSGGKDSVDHPPGYHDDLANAVAGACVLLSRKRVLTEEEKDSLRPHAQGHLSDSERTRERIQQEADEEMRTFMGGRRILHE